MPLDKLFPFDLQKFLALQIQICFEMLTIFMGVIKNMFVQFLLNCVHKLLVNSMPEDAMADDQNFYESYLGLTPQFFGNNHQKFFLLAVLSTLLLLAVINVYVDISVVVPVYLDIHLHLSLLFSLSLLPEVFKCQSNNRSSRHRFIGAVNSASLKGLLGLAA